MAELRDESWKMKAYDELEGFKQQLVLNDAAAEEAGSTAGTRGACGVCCPPAERERGELLTKP